MGRPVILKWKESGDDKDEVVKDGSMNSRWAPLPLKKRL